MVQILKDESLSTRWASFFEEYCQTDLETIAFEYPDKQSLKIDYWEIDRADTELASLLLNDPHKTLANAEYALETIDVAVEKKMKLRFRVFNLPDTQHILIRNIRSHHLGTMAAIDGLVKKRTEVRPKLKVAAFQCQKCHAIIKIAQDEDVLKEPTECYEDQGGCGRVSSFKLSPSLSEFIDSQKLEIQENPEGLRGGAQPERISVFLEDDLVGEISPGDRIIVNGILNSIQRRIGQMRLTSFDKAVQALTIETQQMAFEEVEISAEDEAAILELSQDQELYAKMKASMAPTIYGMELEKEALVLQLFGGVPKEMPDGTRIRGDIHCLFVGDPGTAKSQLLTYMSKISPRSVFTSGKSSTAAGLTAAAVRDEFTGGEFILEAGALVLADMGIACIDEIDKMNDTDRSSMYQAMEQQEISIAKAGINATLKTRCSILSAANPKLGRFDEFSPLHQQINMPPALLSRFDLIFSIIDRPNRKKDDMLATHILQTHRAGEINESVKKTSSTNYNQEDALKILEKVMPVIEAEFMRKYVAYAKRNCYPVLTEEALNQIKQYYVDLRNTAEGTVAFTARQLEAFVRLAEASAKVRLSQIANLDDANRAIYIIDSYLRRVGMDRETGKIDFDIIATGISHSQHDRMRSIIDIIRKLTSESEDGYADAKDIKTEAEINGMKADKVQESLDRLKRDGQIYSPTHGKYLPV